MKNIKLFFLLSFVILFGLFTTPSHYSTEITIAGDEGFKAVEIIAVNNSTNISVSVISPLTWKSNEATNITIEIKLSAIAENDNLTLTYVATSYNIPGKPFPISQKTTVINENLSQVGQEVNKTQTRYAPENTDEFNITVTILAKTENMTDSRELYMDFPGKGESNIRIIRNVALPIINLPGFPNAETFVRWIVIFVVVLLILISPSLFVLYFKIKEKSITRGQNLKERGKKNE